MGRSRRKFLAQSSMLMGGVIAGEVESAAAESLETPQTPVTPSTPGAPPAFGTSAPVGPEVSAATFAEAEKLVQVTMSPAHRAEMAGNWRESMAAVYERRIGPRKVEIGYEDAPATVWNPRLERASEPKQCTIPIEDHSTTIVIDHVGGGGTSYPDGDEDIAFAPVSVLSMMIRDRKITSERLTKIYIERLKRFNPKLNCVITLCEEHALEQARAADKEIAAGKYRGPLHGIPWGAKDLLDTAGIKTTWGAEFYRDRVPQKDATVTQRLNDAGAVLVAKLSLGALALNDVWFGGQTKNPWLLEEGSSGSSAGPGSAVAAGLVSFAIGSETQGSIISPSMRCGVTGLRPTYGRVPVKGAMTLSWTCDKLGPMARSVEDTLLVLNAISGFDPSDTGSVPSPPLRGYVDVKSLRVGYIESWMHEAPATDVDRHALEVVKQLGMTAVPVTLENWAYDSLNVIL